MSKKRFVRLGALGLAVYETLVRPRMLDWGASGEERKMCLPGDQVVEAVMTHHTRAITIYAPPEAIWPWLVQMGDHRAGFYSYDWTECYLFPGTVHRVEGRRSATRIHPELQELKVGDRINTGSIGCFAIGSPVTVLEDNRALVIGRWRSSSGPLRSAGPACSYASGIWAGYAWPPLGDRGRSALSGRWSTTWSASRFTSRWCARDARHQRARRAVTRVRRVRRFPRSRTDRGAMTTALPPETAGSGIRKGSRLPLLTRCRCRASAHQRGVRVARSRRPRRRSRRSQD